MNLGLMILIIGFVGLFWSYHNLKDNEDGI